MPVDVWEWLSLIDHDGPFLSKAALKSFYPSGLPRPDADETSTVFVDEFVRWSAAWSASPEVYEAARYRWVGVVLRRLLDWSDDLQFSPTGLTAESPNGAVMVAPWAALSGEGKPEALVTVVDRTDDLRSTGADGWSANAIDRMAVLLRETGVTIGIVTDGRWWALVSAAKDVTTASGVWDALLWREERPSRDAFLALASFTSIAGGAPEKRLPLVFAKSVASAEEITEALGDQVRRAVELVLQSMSDTHLRALAQGEPSPLPKDPRAAYEGAVTVLMRIVFLLFAEERGLLPEHDLYRSSYAIARIRDQLQRDATATSVEALDHSWETWHRLLAASNAVFGGASFQDMRMPAYGGSLFDPARFPWLHTTDQQGRLRVRLTDRAMLAVLRAVQTIEDGAMQLSFRDLDVEQIGYVYEGLLGYSAAYVPAVTVGLHGKSGFEPEVALTELEEIADAATSPADFAKRLIEHLKKTQEQAKPRTANQIAKAYGVDDAEAAADARTRLRHALLGDDELAARLQPFHGLIRDDLRGFPYVVPADGLVMTESPQRANTGTHYTPRSLAEEVVLHALEPLVYSPGPLDTENRSEWKLKSSAEILDLKIADIAAGSGAFLVAAARYLADRLIEARANEGLDVSRESDLKRWAVREIVARCLYGADINGMAVEMCKLSLWLISMDPGKPFSFVDDRVFHGNSLLGVTSADQLKAQHIYPTSRASRSPLRWFDVDKDLEDASRLRRELASGQVDDADRMRSTKAKQALLVQSARVTARLRQVADGIIAAGLAEGGRPGEGLDRRYDALADALRMAFPVGPGTADIAPLAEMTATGLRTDSRDGSPLPLHWVLEAPDVMIDHGGFDAVIGNPPFLGGPKISGSMGVTTRDWIVNVVAGGSTGVSDLVAYFFRRAAGLVRSDGHIALIATNSVSQGATRAVGLDVLAHDGMLIYRAISSRKWPAHGATVQFACVWGRLGGRTSRPSAILDDRPTPRISTLLEPEGRVTGTPVPLKENSGRAFVGVYVLGRGFVLDDVAAHELIDAAPENRDVVKPYMSGDDLNSRWDLSPSRWVVDFFDLPEQVAAKYALPFAHIEETVKPERQRTREDGSFALRSPLPDRWWQHAEKRPGLVAATQNLDYVITLARVSATIIPVRLPARPTLYSEQCILFATEDYADLAILSSFIHQSWTIRYASTLGAGQRYTPAGVYQPFPQPPKSQALRTHGESLESIQRTAMTEMKLGLTDLYNLVNSRESNSAPVEAVRHAHREIDAAVFTAFGWSDLSPDHAFAAYKGKMRYSLAPSVQLEVLDRLLGENLRRAKTEGAAPTMQFGAESGVAGIEDSIAPEGAMF